MKVDYTFNFALESFANSNEFSSCRWFTPNLFALISRIIFVIKMNIKDGKPAEFSDTPEYIQKFTNVSSSTIKRLLRLAVDKKLIAWTGDKNYRGTRIYKIGQWFYERIAKLEESKKNKQCGTVATIPEPEIIDIEDINIDYVPNRTSVDKSVDNVCELVHHDPANAKSLGHSDPHIKILKSFIRNSCYKRQQEKILHTQDEKQKRKPEIPDHDPLIALKKLAQQLKRTINHHDRNENNF